MKICEVLLNKKHKIIKILSSFLVIKTQWVFHTGNFLSNSLRYVENKIFSEQYKMWTESLKNITSVINRWTLKKLLLTDGDKIFVTYWLFCFLLFSFFLKTLFLYTSLDSLSCYLCYFICMRQDKLWACLDHLKISFKKFRTVYRVI